MHYLIEESLPGALAREILERQGGIRRDLLVQAGGTSEFDIAMNEP